MENQCTLEHAVIREFQTEFGPSAVPTPQVRQFFTPTIPQEDSENTKMAKWLVEKLATDEYRHILRCCFVADPLSALPDQADRCLLHWLRTGRQTIVAEAGDSDNRVVELPEGSMLFHATHGGTSATAVLDPALQETRGGVASPLVAEAASKRSGSPVSSSASALRQSQSPSPKRVRTDCGFHVYAVYPPDHVVRDDWCVRQNVDETVTYETKDCIERFYKKVVQSHYYNQSIVTLTMPHLIYVHDGGLCVHDGGSLCLVLAQQELSNLVVVWLILLKTPEGFIPLVLCTSQTPVMINDDVRQRAMDFGRKKTTEAQKQNPFTPEKLLGLLSRNPWFSGDRVIRLQGLDKLPIFGIRI